MSTGFGSRIWWLMGLVIGTGLVLAGMALAAPQAAGASARAYGYPPTETPTPVPTGARPAETPTPAPLPTPDGVQRRAKVPVLMYHYLSEAPVGADRYRRDLSVSPTLFEEHLTYLEREGYTVISLYDLLDHLVLGSPLPERPVIITFDDGYLDNYQNAFPLLQKYGFTGTFFVVTELAERAQAAMVAPNGFVYADHYVSWDQLREMDAAGLDIECHARVHEDLTGIDADRLVWQVLGCREMIERELGSRPRFIAYPAGRYNDTVMALFASDHYWGGITTRQGNEQRSDALFEITRLRMRGTTSVAELAEMLSWE